MKVFMFVWDNETFVLKRWPNITKHEIVLPGGYRLYPAHIDLINRIIIKLRPANFGKRKQLKAHPVNSLAR